MSANRDPDKAVDMNVPPEDPLRAPGHREPTVVHALIAITAFIGTVTQIAPAARSVLGADATVTIWADLDNGEGLLRPGLEARAKVVGARRPIGYIIARPLIRWINMTFWR